MDEEVAPLLIAPPEYLELRNRLFSLMGFPNKRLPLLIGIDGFDGAGKSSLAAWLSWQLGMPAIQLDLYIRPNTDPLAFKANELAVPIDARLTTGRPLIVEGILLLDAMAAINRRPDVLIFVEREGNGGTLSKYIEPYIDRQKPHARASHILTWSSIAHDDGVARAHLRLLSE
ncbi:hypothetical protein [Bradyrhizobium guangzhouense]|uniref:hypothetical protein n=1 Tax=Bradyrhizobium guangzhouense TaxID=1325095 RepID=UPI001009C5AC|nr:hypothetical protein [Bradyrhizobium guangzhouense]RXH19809.1 hypothetical protein EAS54_06445 [Bradyrhizobium guangzhouense]